MWRECDPIQSGKGLPYQTPQYLRRISAAASAAAAAAAAVSLCNRQHSTSSHHPVAVSQQDTDLADKATMTTYLPNDQQQQPIFLNHVLPIIQLSDYEANLNDWLSRIVIFKSDCKCVFGKAAAVGRAMAELRGMTTQFEPNSDLHTQETILTKGK
uniref:Uncharacterized protein n=1 Tax=Glossina austeni TaxID=7395 RepID=A0A1A9UGX3_GLOAU